MNLQCKKCGESFETTKPFDLFEFRRHKLLPADSEGMTHTDTVEEAGAFCSRKCLSDYLASKDVSGVFNLSALRDKMKQEGKL